MVVTTASNTLCEEQGMFSTAEKKRQCFANHHIIISYAPWAHRLQTEEKSMSQLALVLGLLSFTGSFHHDYHITCSRLGYY